MQQGEHPGGIDGVQNLEPTAVLARPEGGLDGPRPEGGAADAEHQERGGMRGEPTALVHGPIQSPAGAVEPEEANLTGSLAGAQAGRCRLQGSLPSGEVIAGDGEAGSAGRGGAPEIDTKQVRGPHRARTLPPVVGCA